MMRQFVPLACLGTALLPAGALALGWRTYSAPCPPAACYLPPVVYLPDCAPPVEFYAPAESYAPAPAPARTNAAPRVTQDPPARPVPAKPDAPAAPAPKAPTPERPRVSLDAPEAAPAEAVRIPATVPVIPVTPAAQPRAVEPEPVRLPPLVPRVPGNEGGLPPLKIAPPAGPSTSGSSPLADRRAFEVVPAVGGVVPAPGGLRSVGIFNHTDRDVTLTVEGETVTLPARSYVTAAVPRRFAWRLGAGEPQSTEVPPDAPGVEIVLRR